MKPKPNWQPISMLPLLQDIILGMGADIESFYNTILPVKHKPYVLDDYTVNRMEASYTENKESILIYKKQLEKWRKEEDLTETQAETIDKLYESLKKTYKITKEILKITAFCKDKTIENVLGKSDGELGLETLLGMFDMDDD